MQVYSSSASRGLYEGKVYRIVNRTHIELTMPIRDDVSLMELGIDMPGRLPIDIDVVVTRGKQEGPIAGLPFSEKGSLKYYLTSIPTEVIARHGVHIKAFRIRRGYRSMDWILTEDFQDYLQEYNEEN